MNISSFVVLTLIVVAVWYAIRTIRRNDGHACRGCRDAHCCKKGACPK